MITSQTHISGEKVNELGNSLAQRTQGFKLLGMSADEKLQVGGKYLTEASGEGRRWQSASSHFGNEARDPLGPAKPSDSL